MISQSDQAKIVEMYPATGYVRIAKMLGLPRGQVRQALVDNGVTIQKQKRYKYNLDAHAFDSLDSELAAYWLGFIYADGCVSQNALRIDVHIRDSGHLAKIGKFLKTKRPLLDSSSVGFGKRTPKVLFQARNDHMAERLKGLGILPGRPCSNLATSQIPPRQVHHFIRGYFDGDGCVGEKRHRIRFCGQRDILEWIASICAQRLETDTRKRLHRFTNTSEIFDLAFGARKDAVAIRNFIYSGATVWLERKRDKTKDW